MPTRLLAIAAAASLTLGWLAVFTAEADADPTVAQIYREFRAGRLA